jgi:NADH-quinone oxidoreductase subunit D
MIATPSRSATERAPGRTMTLQMGPHHPSTHGVLRLELDVEGERVLRCRTHVGYLHRCAEKLAERDRYLQAITHLDRTDYVAAMANNLAYVEAVEALLGIEAPRRARLLRTLLCEFQRIASHLLSVATHLLEIGAMTVFFHAFREREKVLDLFEIASGARLTYSYIRFGGFPQPPPPRFYARARDLLPVLEARVAELDRLVTKNPIFRARSEGVAVLRADDAIALGASGPMLRASGVRRDLRRDIPYAAYDEVEVEPQVETAGDNYARFLVRMREIGESIRACRRCLDLLAEADGAWVVDDPRLIPPPREEIYADMAKMIRHWIIAIRGFPVPPGEVYRAVETPRGEMGVYLVADGTGRPYRAHYRSPSFVHLMPMERMARGRMIADLAAIVGSVDVVIGDTDR